MPGVISARRYASADREAWDAFVRRSKNGVFLFERAYIEYHADRFTDASLLFFDDDALIALLPASLDGEALVSHGGLTYGGVITDDTMKVPVMLEIFGGLVEHARAAGIARIIYKPVPHIYHRLPAEEDLYALFRHDARLFRRDVSSTLMPASRPRPSKGRKSSIKRGKTLGITVERSADFGAFMAIEEAHLVAKHQKKPVHTAEEMERLAAGFPDNIKLFVACREGRTVGGIIVYETPLVAHAQYIAANEEGKETGALDVVIDHLIGSEYADKQYFDFGISTTEGGRSLDTGLIGNKESFGGRATVYDFYELPVK
jgi:Acetyltransferase (GNAT) domain